MAEAAKRRLQLDLDTALRYAAVLGWHAVMEVTARRSLRVEYVAQPGEPLDHLEIWAVGPAGEEELVCDCWAQPSMDHPGGTSFQPGYGAPVLAQAIDFILQHQDLFERPAGAPTEGLVRVAEPSEEEHAEAIAWLNRIEQVERSEI